MRIERIVDLSVSLHDATQVYPGDPQLRFAVHSTIADHGFNLLSVQMGSQSGTHVDAPFHFDDSSARIDEVALDHFLGTGVLVDARSVGARAPIGWDLIEPVADRLLAGRILLLWTGWSRHFGTAAYFDHPYLDADACRRVLDLGVRTFAIDAINLDETPDSTHLGVGYPVHHLVAEAGGVICENLTNLAAIDFAEPLISLLPLSFRGADGAPVRAVAVQVAP